jgi:Shikimate 5-dehydrogenase
MSDQYAVIGNPIGHTKSPLIHRFFAEESQQDMSYTAIEGPVEPDDASAATVRSFIAEGGKGMNVTAPFKLKAFAMADERSERAALAGAANALSFRDGRSSRRTSMASASSGTSKSI